MLKLGSGTGSLVNHFYSLETNGRPLPKVGDGATVLSWSDRDAGTIIKAVEVTNGFEVTVQMDTAVRTDNNGMSDCQTYEYTRNPNGATHRFRFDRLRADKGWRQVHTNAKGRTVLSGSSSGLRIGTRDKHYDFSF